MAVLTESELRRPKDDSWIKNYGLIAIIAIVVLGMFYLPYRAGKNMLRGHRRSWPETVFKTLLMNLILIAAGWWIAMVLFVGIVPDPADGEITIAEAQEKREIGRASARNVVVFSFLIGAFVGLTHRPKFYRDLHNDKFLSNAGFLLVNNDREYPYQDGYGYRVKIMDPARRKMDVLYYRHPNYRGVLELDRSGRIQNYSGPIDLQKQ